MATYFAVVVSLVLIPAVMLALDAATLIYHRTKLKATADALALGIVGETQSLHLPIPTTFVGFLPVDGFVLNGLHLKNLNWDSTIPKGNKLLRLADLNRDVIGQATQVKVTKAVVRPAGNTFSPFMYVEVPVDSQVKLQTPFLSNLLGGKGDGSFTIRDQSCGIAWYELDSWVHRWWSDETLDIFIDIDGEPKKFYRLTNCVDEGLDLISLMEQVITEEIGSGKSGRKREIQKRIQGKLGKDAGRLTETLGDLARKGSRGQAGCGPGSPCIDLDKESLKRWARETEEAGKRQAEAESP